MPSSRRPTKSSGVDSKLAMSRSSGPAIACSISAASVTVRVSGPTCEISPLAGVGQYGTRPCEGLMPYTPQNAAGIRIDPAPSEPWWIGPIPAAAQTAAPALEAPAFIPCFQGLCVMPVSGLLLTPLQPNSETVVLPMEIAPAARRRSTCALSKSGTRSRKICEPAMVRTPRVKARSLMLVGTPCRMPKGRPRMTAVSASAAASIAASNVGVQIALSRGFNASARAMVCRITSTGDTVFCLIMRTSSLAGTNASSSLIAMAPWAVLFPAIRSTDRGDHPPNHASRFELIQRAADLGQRALFDWNRFYLASARQCDDLI